MKNNTEFMNAVKTMRGGGKSGPPSKFSLSRLIMEYQTHNPSEARRREAVFQAVLSSTCSRAGQLAVVFALCRRGVSKQNKKVQRSCAYQCPGVLM